MSLYIVRIPLANDGHIKIIHYDNGCMSFYNIKSTTLLTFNN